jgi:septum formation protein
MLILASASPRRREMLERLGIAIEVVPAEIDEAPFAGEAPISYAERIAAAKAEAVGERNPHRFVLAADTVVICGPTILGKPKDIAEAGAMLRRLSGRMHTVATAYHILGPTGPRARAITTEVDIAPLTPADLDAYLESGEWEGKAGAYAIQGIFAYAVSAIRGSYTNVVGLPLHEVLSDLQHVGALPDFPRDGFRR